MNLNGRVKNGKLAEVKKCVESKDKKYDLPESNALGYAGYGGQMEVIKYLIANGYTNFNKGLIGGCCGGSLEIVELMISHKADDLEYGLYFALRKKRTDVIEYLTNKIKVRNESKKN